MRIKRRLVVKVLLVTLTIFLVRQLRGGAEVERMLLIQHQDLVRNLTDNRLSSSTLFHDVPPDENFSKIKTEVYLELRIWVDVPNDKVPWRKCVDRYSDNAATLTCHPEEHPDSTWRVLLLHPQFHIYTHDYARCLEPLYLESDSRESLYIIIGKCTEGTWSYTEAGQLRWSDGGGCLTSLGPGSGNKLTLTDCDNRLAEQRFEFGVVKVNQNNTPEIHPLDLGGWTERQRKIRDVDVAYSKKEVEEALNYTVTLSGPVLRRRAVVFYLDQGSHFMMYLNWWLLTWKLLGLNSEEASFDIVMFTHPYAVSYLPVECVELKPDEIDSMLQGQGKCLYVPLVGIIYRDQSYDKYMNSHECLYNPKAWFLTRYSHLLRSDIDTFPLPGLVDSWPESLLANVNMKYTFKHKLTSITTALKDAAAYVGIQHNGWHDIGSSWFGPTERVLKASRLTVALSKFLRHYLFGPGTLCRCATCTYRREECTWGGGIYASTNLLYAQEIAMNSVWTEKEYQEMKYSFLDLHATTNENICDPNALHIHTFHGNTAFSKFCFKGGDYDSLDMRNLNLTINKDYCMYLALKSAGKGTGETEISAKYNIHQPGSLRSICAKNT